MGSAAEVRAETKPKVLEPCRGFESEPPLLVGLEGTYAGYL